MELVTPAEVPLTGLGDTASVEVMITVLVSLTLIKLVKAIPVVI